MSICIYDIKIEMKLWITGTNKKWEVGRRQGDGESAQRVVYLYDNVLMEDRTMVS